ncbi:MAG TPA: TlpA disulfide reductase family protein [Nitrospirota bacterium]
MKQGILIASLFFLLAAPAFAAFKMNDPAPDFSLKDREGHVFTLSDVVGANSKEKANGVILNFFASWCVPCREELPLINALVDELKGKGVKVVLIGHLEDFDAMQEMLAALKVNKPLVLSDPDGKVGERYGLRFLPVTYFIGGDGKLKHIIFGEIESEKELRKIAEKLLK